MLHKKKALFITHAESINFNSDISGGVQYCSREFFRVIEHSGYELTPYYLDYTSNLLKRTKIKLKLDTYDFISYDKKIKELLDYLSRKENEIDTVFINMVGFIRVAKELKNKFGRNLRIVLISHGNDSGDFLHLTTNPIGKQGFIKKILQIYRLGKLLYLESLYRKKYIDSVLCVSETERQIENWLGSKSTYFVPRAIDRNSFKVLKPISGRIGFVGRLDHPPNYQGIMLVLRELREQESEVDFRLVGAPSDWGLKIKKEFDFVNYLGELTDEELDNEVKTWSMFLNPVFWYSTGVTTKFAKALEWGVPIVTTTQGYRGYVWEKGSPILVKDYTEMVKKIEGYADNSFEIERAIEQVNLIRNSSPTIEKIGANLHKYLDSL